jgi:hypothetical protein
LNQNGKEFYEILYFYTKFGVLPENMGKLRYIYSLEVFQYVSVRDV